MSAPINVEVCFFLSHHWAVDGVEFDAESDLVAKVAVGHDEIEILAVWEDSKEKKPRPDVKRMFEDGFYDRAFEDIERKAREAAADRDDSEREHAADLAADMAREDRR